MVEAYSINETAQRLGCQRTALRRWLRDGQLAQVGTDDSGRGSPSILVNFGQADALVAELKESQARPHLPNEQRRELETALANGTVLPGTPIPVTEGAKKYDVSKQRVSQLAKEGKIQVLSWTDGTNGERRVETIDESDLATWAAEFHRKRSNRSGQRAMKSLGRAKRQTSPEDRPADFPPGVTPAPVEIEVPEGSLTTGLLAQDYFAYLKEEKGNRPETLKEARFRLAPFIKMFPVLPLKEEPIYEYFRSLKGKQLTKFQKAARLRAFYNWLWKRKKYIRKYTQTNLFDDIEMPNKGGDILTPLTEANVVQLLSSAPTMRQYAAMIVCVGAGLRRGEASRIRAELMEPATETSPARVFFDGGKKGNASVPVTQKIYDALKDIAPPKGYVFHGRDPGSPITPNAFTSMVADAFKAAGISADMNGPQILRHTFNAMVKRRASTENTARMSRHDPMLTMRVYGRLGDPEIDAEYIKVSATINLPPPPKHLGIQHQLPMEGG